MLDAPVQPDKPEHKNRPNDIFHHHLIRGRNNIIKAKSDMQALVNFTVIPLIRASAAPKFSAKP
ncbi:hypothetical protein JL996_05900 [Acinetobacter baumannii]|nr:hypothetical protein [Acinetobacter baumannii]